MSTPARPEPLASPPDPWKGLRGVMAGTLVLEVIIVLLALPVISTVGGGISLVAGLYVGLLTLLLVLGAGLQRRPWALTYNLAVQVLFVAGLLVNVPLGIAGIVFAFLWALILVFRRDVARRLEAGTLRSQYPPS
ncbi:DUF4233 domain-containing protein [Rhodococcus aerolatus]